MEQEILQRRNFLFNLVYQKATSFYITYIPKPLRWSMEAGLLVMAFATLALWGYIHFVFILDPKDCLQHVTERPLPSDIILQVETFTNSTFLWNERELTLLKVYRSIPEETYSSFSSDDESTSDNYWPGESVAGHWTDHWFDNIFDIQNPHSNPSLYKHREGSNGHPRAAEASSAEGDSVYGTGLHSEEPTTEDVWNTDAVAGSEDYVRTSQKHEDNVKNSTDSDWGQSHAHTSSMESHTLYDLFDIYSLKLLSFDYTILEFSQEPGYLSLSQSARTRLNITIVKTFIDPENTTCYGGPIGQFLSKYFLGYEMMIIASFKNLLPHGRSSGYVKNLLTGNQYYYRIQWMGKWRYGAGMLPAFFFTLVASLLIRQVHYHFFKFLIHFHNLLNQGIPMPIQTGAQIPFLIITYAAIGLIIVMSEALSDDSVFSILMVFTVWEADQFYAIFCKQEISKQFFPWFFYLYHFIPYAYYVRFNGQFWFIPFLFHWLLLQHAMLFFLHYWELPTAAIRYNFPRQRAIPVQGDDLQEQLAELPANVQENQVPPPMLELSDDEDLAEVQPVEPIQTHSRQQQQTEIDQRSPYETIATQHISGSSHVDTEGHESGMYTYNEQFSKEECNIGAPSALVTTSMKIRDQLSRCSKTDSTNQTNVSVTNDPLIGSTQPEPGAYPVERVQCIETENLGEHAQ